MFKVIIAGDLQIFDLYGEKCLLTSSDRRIVALRYEIRVAESNGGVRSLAGSSEIVVSARVQ